LGNFRGKQRKRKNLKPSPPQRNRILNQQAKKKEGERSPPPPKCIGGRRFPEKKNARTLAPWEGGGEGSLDARWHRREEGWAVFAKKPQKGVWRSEGGQGGPSLVGKEGKSIDRAPRVSKKYTSIQKKHPRDPREGSSQGSRRLGEEKIPWDGGGEEEEKKKAATHGEKHGTLRMRKGACERGGKGHSRIRIIAKRKTPWEGVFDNNGEKKRAANSYGGPSHRKGGRPKGRKKKKSRIEEKNGKERGKQRRTYLFRGTPNI